MRKFTVTVNGQDYDVVVKDGGAAAAAPAPAPVGAGESVEAPMPGKVIRIEKHVGDAVAAGDEVLVLEAMKMGNPIMAPCDGKVTSMQVSEGQSVQGGDPLFTVG